MSPQAEKTKNEGFGLACDENMGFFEEHNQSIRIECLERNSITKAIDLNIHECVCRPYRLTRNSVMTKIV